MPLIWPSWLGVKRLVLFHHDPTRTDQMAARLARRMLRRVRKHGSNLDVIAAAEGQDLELLETVSTRSDSATGTRPVITRGRRIMLAGGDEKELVLDSGAKPLESGVHSQRFTMDETLARMERFPRWFMGRRLGDPPQIVGDHAPADPAFPSVGTMIPAAIQLVAPFQPTDPALDARAPVVATPEPALLLMRHPFGRLGPWLGQHPLLDAARGRLPLVRGGGETAIPGQQPGWTLEHLPMMVQTRRPWRVFGGIALQHGIAADDAALDRIQPEHPAACGGPARLAFADNGGMGLKQADHLLRGRDGVTLEDASGRLGHHLLHQWAKPVQRGDELPANGCPLLGEDGRHTLRLGDHRGGDGE